MERHSHKKRGPASAILTADWHLREDQPVCRTDDFWETQWKKVTFISNLQKEHACAVIHAGDLFNHWKPSPNLISQTILKLPDKFFTIYGNHDLPQHNLDNARKSGVFTLAASKTLQLLSSGHWGVSPEQGSLIGYHIGNSTILVWHGLVIAEGAPTWPGCIAVTPKHLLKKYPKYPLILTGHNHQPFVAVYENRYSVNPGSLTRQTADQNEMKPRVYLWWEDTNEIEPVYLPIDDSIISREHLINAEQSEARQNRMEAFLELLQSEGWEAEVSFERNVDRLMDEKQLPNSVREIILAAVGK